MMQDKIAEYAEKEIQNGATQIAVCRITDTDYYHHSEYESRLGFVYYQKEPKDVEFKEVAIKEWLQSYYESD